MGVTEIYELLEKHTGRFFSEEEIASSIGVSKVAIHKSMRTVVTYPDIFAHFKHKATLGMRKKKAWHYAHIKPKLEGY